MRQIRGLTSRKNYFASESCAFSRRMVENTVVTERRQMAARADGGRTLARSYGYFDALLVGTEVGLL